MNAVLDGSCLIVRTAVLAFAFAILHSHSASAGTATQMFGPKHTLSNMGQLSLRTGWSVGAGGFSSPGSGSDVKDAFRGWSGAVRGTRLHGGATSEGAPMAGVMPMSLEQEIDWLTGRDKADYFLGGLADTQDTEPTGVMSTKNEMEEEIDTRAADVAWEDQQRVKKAIDHWYSVGRFVGGSQEGEDSNEDAERSYDTGTSSTRGRLGYEQLRTQFTARPGKGQTAVEAVMDHAFRSAFWGQGEGAHSTSGAWAIGTLIRGGFCVSNPTNVTRGSLDATMSTALDAALKAGASPDMSRGISVAMRVPSDVQVNAAFAKQGLEVHIETMPNADGSSCVVAVAIFNPKTNEFVISGTRNRDRFAITGHAIVTDTK